MRLWLVIGVLVAAALLVAVVPRLGGDDPPHTVRPGQPETVAAAYALTYARGMEVGDASIACYTMTKDAARAVGCGTPNAHPRACGHFNKTATRIVRYEETRATVEVGSCRIDMVPGASTQWAVSKVEAASR